MRCPCAGNTAFTCGCHDAGMDRRTLLFRAAAGLASASPGWAGAAPTADEPWLDETWHDATRARELPLRLRWPDGSAPCALVVHSHGLGGNREGGDAWGRAWRRAGFAVLHVQHPGSDTDTLRQGLRALRGAASAEQLIARAADMRFVLDELERRARAGGTPWSRVRLDAIGASGHSFGAQTVLAVAGKRFPVRAPAFVEPRFRAFIAFSPALGREDGQSPTQQFGAIERPLLLLTGSLDGDPLNRAFEGEDRARVYEGLPAGKGTRALLWLDGADHMSFGGNAARPLAARRGRVKRDGAVAAEREPAHHALIAQTTTLWWRAQLLGDAAAATALRAPQGLAQGDRWLSD
jgi:predicted dienelactone hydrolase